MAPPANRQASSDTSRRPVVWVAAFTFALTCIGVVIALRSAAPPAPPVAKTFQPEPLSSKLARIQSTLLTAEDAMVRMDYGSAKAALDDAQLALSGVLGSADSALTSSGLEAPTPSRRSSVPSSAPSVLLYK